MEIKVRKRTETVQHYVLTEVEIIEAIQSYLSLKGHQIKDLVSDDLTWNSSDYGVDGVTVTIVENKEE